MPVSYTHLDVYKRQVLGYQNREINKMILNINHILVVIGFLLAIPASVAAVKILCVNMVSLLLSLIHI